jgi:hypothetical protein
MDPSLVNQLMTDVDLKAGHALFISRFLPDEAARILSMVAPSVDEAKAKRGRRPKVVISTDGT